METTNVPNYNCSQATLYSTSRTMWENCRNYLTEMSAFKPLYTPAYIDLQIEAIATAERMKSQAARALAHKQLREDLIVLGEICRDEWIALKLYIMTAFTKELREMNWDAAGWQSYADAGNDNWDKVNELMTAGSEYIAANATVLAAHHNMPPSFSVAFNTAKDAFAAKYMEFIQAEEGAEVGTSDKITANNAIYTKVIEMGQDGQFVMRGSESTRKQFSFEAVSELISPSGASSVVLTIMNEDDMPMNGVTAEVVGSDKTGTSDSTGRLPINQLPSGPVTIKLIADGFNEKTIEMTLKTGTTSRETVNMEPLFTGAMNVGPVETKVLEEVTK